MQQALLTYTIKENGLNKINGNIPPELDIPEGADLLVVGNDQTWSTHGFHKYPAKYIPEFPRWAIEKYSKKGDVVLDPFSGSGTTAVEAVVLRRKSVAIDVDPLALLLTRVKTTPISAEKLKAASQILIKKITMQNRKPKNIPKFKNRDHWFKPEVVEKLSIIKEAINEEQNKTVRDFFLVTFSSIIRSVSNADTGSHKPCIRKNKKRTKLPDPIERFILKLHKNIKGMTIFSILVRKNSVASEIVGKDALDIYLKDKSVNLAVTSPPYINALDYVRTHKLEYYWLEWFKDSLVDLKKKFVGTEQVYSKSYKKLHKTGLKDLDKIINKIFLKDKKRAYVVFKYFQDMKQNLKEVHRILTAGGKYVIFIGNNCIKGHTIENYKFLRDIAERVGFKTINYFKSGIINHYIPFDRAEKIDKDFVLILEK